MKKEKVLQKLYGPVFTIYTPFVKDKSCINFHELEKYINFLFNKGVSIFYVMPYNSRYSQLRESEIFELNNFCIETVKNLSPENLIIVSDSIHGPTSLSIDYALEAKKTGADIFASIVRGKYFDDKQILMHYENLSRAVSIPLLVHEMPFLSGYTAQNILWPLTLLKGLKEIDNIIAIKEDAKDEVYAQEIIKIFEPDIRVIFAGRKKYFYALKESGLKSYLNGISMVNPKLAFKFWDLYEKGEDDAILEFLSKYDDPFWDGPVKKYGWHRVNKASLEIIGLMSRIERSPLQELNKDELKEIKPLILKIANHL